MQLGLDYTSLSLASSSTTALSLKCLDRSLKTKAFTRADHETYPYSLGRGNQEEKPCMQLSRSLYERLEGPKQALLTHEDCEYTFGVFLLIIFTFHLASPEFVLPREHWTANGNHIEDGGFVCGSRNWARRQCRYGSGSAEIWLRISKLGSFR
jgi:hypothetical protein